MKQTWLDSHNLSSAIFLYSLTDLSIMLLYLYLLDFVCLFVLFVCWRIHNDQVLPPYRVSFIHMREQRSKSWKLWKYDSRKFSGLHQYFVISFNKRGPNDILPSYQWWEQIQYYKGKKMQGLWSKLSTGLKFLCFDKNYLTCDPESDRWKGVFIWCCIIHLHVFFSS